MSGRETARFVAVWAVGLLALGALGVLMGERDRVALSELPAAALGALVLAAGVALLGRRRDREGPPASVGAATLGLGLTLAGAAAAVGVWLLFIAAPVLAVGLYALVTEGRA